MISETTLAQSYASLWNFYAPRMDQFVRALNLKLYERFLAPISSTTRPERRGLINEAAFRLFCRHVLTRSEMVTFRLSKEMIKACATEAKSMLVRVDSVATRHFADLDDDEEKEVALLYSRTKEYFDGHINRSTLIVRPQFPGCGIVDTCEGDVLIENILYEIKAGDRPFRSVDVKQLLAYAVLNFEARTHEIRSVALLNPRLGTVAIMNIDEISMAISGRPSAEFLPEISRCLSSGDLSR